MHVVPANNARVVAVQVRIFMARVRSGRLVLDEAVGAPFPVAEGETVELVSIDELLLNGGVLSADDDRAALDRRLEASLAEAEEGQLLDFSDVLAELRAKQGGGSER